MAVHARESITGIFARYERQKHDSDHGRMALLLIHDEAYDGVLATIDETYGVGAFDEIQVVDRDLSIVAKVKAGDGIPSELISRQRNEMLAKERTASISEDWRLIFESMKARGASEVEYANAEVALSVIDDNIHSTGVTE